MEEETGSAVISAVAEVAAETAEAVAVAVDGEAAISVPHAVAAQAVALVECKNR